MTYKISRVSDPVLIKGLYFEGTAECSSTDNEPVLALVKASLVSPVESDFQEVIIPIGIENIGQELIGRQLCEFRTVVTRNSANTAKMKAIRLAAKID